jgi:hypothetical protein
MDIDMRCLKIFDPKGFNAYKHIKNIWELGFYLKIFYRPAAFCLCCRKFDMGYLNDEACLKKEKL